MKRRFLLKVLSRVVAATAFTLATAAPAWAQDYPQRVVSWIVPFAAGGPTDSMARMIAERVAKHLGQTIIIENVPGAGGTIGAARVARAKPDGYTLLVGHVGYMAAAPSLYARLQYDPVKDFEPVFRFPDTPMVLVVNKDAPAKDVKSFIELAKKQPGKLTLGNAGPGSTSHLVAALFATAADIKLTLVPYKGAGPALNDVMGGQIDGMFDQSNTILPQLSGGRLSAIAVTSRQRLPQLPNVPTLQEAGVKGFEAATWYGLYAPKGTSQSVIDKLAAAYQKVMADKEFIARMQEQGIQLLPADQYGAAALGKHTSTELAKWRDVITKAGIKLD
jgi:tripartite-type tricarboxylate transporter receptor subunit TctC